MKRRQKLTPGEKLAEAEMAKRHEEQMDKKGLCRFCAERPQNPFLNGAVCLDCYKDHPNGCCTADGCYDSIAGRYEQMALCEVHLADTLHKEYQRYISLRGELYDKKFMLGFVMADKLMDDAEGHTTANSVRNQITIIQRELDILESSIKKANNEAGGVFPDNYETF